MFQESSQQSRHRDVVFQRVTGQLDVATKRPKGANPDQVFIQERSKVFAPCADVVLNVKSAVVGQCRGVIDGFDMQQSGADGLAFRQSCSDEDQFFEFRPVSHPVVGPQVDDAPSSVFRVSAFDLVVSSCDELARVPPNSVVFDQQAGRWNGDIVGPAPDTKLSLYFRQPAEPFSDFPFIGGDKVSATTTDSLAVTQVRQTRSISVSARASAVSECDRVGVEIFPLNRLHCESTKSLSDSREAFLSERLPDFTALFFSATLSGGFPSAAARCGVSRRDVFRYNRDRVSAVALSVPSQPSISQLSLGGPQKSQLMQLDTGPVFSRRRLFPGMWVGVIFPNLMFQTTTGSRVPRRQGVRCGKMRFTAIAQALPFWVAGVLNNLEFPKSLTAEVPSSTGAFEAAARRIRACSLQLLARTYYLSSALALSVPCSAFARVCASAARYSERSETLTRQIFQLHVMPFCSTFVKPTISLRPVMCK